MGHPSDAVHGILAFLNYREGEEALLIQAGRGMAAIEEEIERNGTGVCVLRCVCVAFVCVGMCVLRVCGCVFLYSVYGWLLVCVCVCVDMCVCTVCVCVWQVMKVNKDLSRFSQRWQALKPKALTKWMSE